MSSIFCKEYPKENIEQFIKDIASKQSNDDYFFDINLFKKAKFNNQIKPFIESLDEFYKRKYKYYLTRDNTFKNLLTIMRQLCKYHDIPYYKKIKYQHNDYNIVYFFSL